MHQRKMKCEKEPPDQPGVYALKHSAGEVKIAFVGHCANLRHRRAVWEYGFRTRERQPNYQMTVKMFPDIPGEQWEFVWFACDPAQHKATETVFRTALTNKGYQMVEKTTRNAVVLSHAGVTGKMTELCAHFGVPYNRAYYLWRKGEPLDKVFAKKEPANANG
jgi:hypothetical protein